MIFGEETRTESLSLANDLEKVRLRSKDELLLTFENEQGVENKLKESIAKISKRCIDNEGGIYDKKLNEDFLFLYELFVDEELKEKFSLNSFDSFSERWLGGLRGKDKARFVEKIRSFIDMKIHPQRVIELWDKNMRSSYHTSGVVEYPGVWYLLPDSEEGVYLDCVEQGVIDEIISLKEEGVDFDSDYYHTSSSAVWQGVLDEGGLRSGRGLLKKNKAVRSGELVTTFGQFPGEQEVASISSLKDVYVERGMALGYATIKWFDEFPVVFGISKPKMVEWKMTTDGDLGELFVDLPRGDGVILGEFVPKNVIEIVYCPFVRKQEVIQRVEESGLNWRVVSIEAYKLLHRFDSALNPGDREVVKDWQNLRDMGKRESL